LRLERIRPRDTASLNGAKAEPELAAATVGVENDWMYCACAAL
jgi:hypothetical protein